ncbi:hypothetical protein [Nocardiopsis sp. MG754419]|uniref:hypothetical protein n=1 Tax=Nocardiopsis sp. MG754419 TaxID=2259865 RepID=UPI001BADE535|nr:hypothetical protein [Nocardiopsis sp. MG754419]
MFTLLTLATTALSLGFVLIAVLKKASSLAGIVADLWKKLTDIRQWRDARLSTSDKQVEQALSFLTRKVRDRAEAGKNVLAADEARLVKTSWSLSSEVMDHPDHALKDTEEFTVSASDFPILEDFFLNKTRYQRLAIVGASGIGKTTIALGLCEAILTKREKDCSAPVPVLVNASSWCLEDGGRMIDQADRSIQREYPDLRTKRASYGANPIRELLLRKQIILIVDGTDELGRHWCTRFLEQVDADAERPFILLCRSDEYNEALPPRGVVANMAVLKAAPLDTEERVRSIRAMLSPSQLREPNWKLFLDEMSDSPQGTLAQALDTPFKIWLLRVNYIDAGENPSVLLDRERFPAEVDLRAHLISGLIPALMKRSLKGNHQRLKFINPQEAKESLGYIAHLMWRAKTSAFEWWRLPSLVGRRQADLAFATVVCGGSFAFLCLASIGFFIQEAGSGIRPDLSALVLQIMLVGMLFSLLFLAAYRGGTKSALDAKPRIGQSEPRIPSDVLRGEMRSFLLTPLKLTFLIWSLFLAAFLILGLWMVDHIIEHDPGFDTMISTGHATRSEIIKLFLPNVIIVSIFGALVPVFFVLIFSSFRGLERSTGLLCFIVSLALSIAGRLPFRWLVFLQEMHSHGVMRAYGASYQFRHAELLEHLAWWHRTQHVGRRRMGLYDAGRWLAVGTATAIAVGVVLYTIVA